MMQKKKNKTHQQKYRRQITNDIFSSFPDFFSGEDEIMLMSFECFAEASLVTEMKDQ